MVNLGDKLCLLDVFLAANVGACAHDTPATPSPIALSAEQMRRPLLELCVRECAALYAYNDAAIALCAEHMPGVDPEVFSRLRMWNALARLCPRMPPQLAVLVFVWIACTHSGVMRLFADTEPRDSWWLVDSRLDRLGEFFAAHIIEVSNRDTSTMLWHAVMFHAALTHVVTTRAMALICADGVWRPERVPKALKERIILAHKAREAREAAATAASEPAKRVRFALTTSAAPPTSHAAVMANSSSPPSAGSMPMNTTGGDTSTV